MLTSKPTHGGGAPFGIDLEAGIARITVRRPAAAPDEEEATGTPADHQVAVTQVADETPAPDDE